MLKIPYILRLFFLSILLSFFSFFVTYAATDTLYKTDLSWDTIKVVHSTSAGTSITLRRWGIDYISPASLISVNQSVQYYSVQETTRYIYLQFYSSASINNSLCWASSCFMLVSFDKNTLTWTSTASSQVWTAMQVQSEVSTDRFWFALTPTQNVCYIGSTVSSPSPCPAISPTGYIWSYNLATRDILGTLYSRALPWTYATIGTTGTFSYYGGAVYLKNFSYPQSWSMYFTVERTSVSPSTFAYSTQAYTANTVWGWSIATSESGTYRIKYRFTVGAWPVYTTDVTSSWFTFFVDLTQKNNISTSLSDTYTSPFAACTQVDYTIITCYFSAVFTSFNQSIGNIKSTASPVLDINPSTLPYSSWSSYVPSLIPTTYATSPLVTATMGNFNTTSNPSPLKIPYRIWLAIMSVVFFVTILAFLAATNPLVTSNTWLTHSTHTDSKWRVSTTSKDHSGSSFRFKL